MKMPAKGKGLAALFLQEVTGVYFAYDPMKLNIIKLIELFVSSHTGLSLS